MPVLFASSCKKIVFLKYGTYLCPSTYLVVFKDHVEDSEEVLEQIKVPIPKRVGADAGYGSEENYEYLEEQGIEAFNKYPPVISKLKMSIRQKGG